MQIRAIYRGAHISAFKCREVTREIQGLPVAAALDVLTFTSRKAARLVEKTLKSAIANAENNNNLRADRLVVQEAVVGEAATLKRFQPKARGSAGPIRKRTSHIRIILTDEVEIKPTRAELRTASKKKKKAPVARPAKAPKSEKPAPAPEAISQPEPETAPAAEPSPAPAPEAPAASAPESPASESTTSTQE